MPAVWPGVCSGRDLEVADHDRRAGRHRAVGARDLGALGVVDEDLHVGPARGELVELADVVVVVVGEQDVGRRDAVLVGRVDERLDRSAGVDEEARATLLAHEIGVGQELRMHRSLEDHGR